jgi:ribosomal protein L37AE/L43A
VAQQPLTTARTVHCTRCGGDVPVTRAAAEVRCPFCQAHVAMPAWLQHELASYEGSLRQREQDLAREHAHGAMWAMYRRGNSGTGLVLLAFFGVPALVAGLGALGALLGMYSTESLAQNGAGVMPFVMYGGVGLAIYLSYRRWRKARDARPGLAAGQSAVACPTCGGRNVMRAGVATEQCAFCGATLLPSRTLMMRAVADAEAQVRAARLARYREEREGMVRVLSYSAGSQGFMWWYMGFVFALPVVGGMVALTGAALSDNPELMPGVYAGWPIVLGVLALLIALAMRRRDRRRRTGEALAALATQFGGEVRAGAQQLVGWLNALWAGPYDVRGLYAGKGHKTVPVVVGGYQVLVDLEPDGLSASRGGYEPRLLVLLAAAMPGAPEAGTSTLPETPAVRSAARWLRDAGFGVSAQSAGLLAAATPAVLARCKKHPELLAGLAPVVNTMVTLAHALDGAAVHPSPVH